MVWPLLFALLLGVVHHVDGADEGGDIQHTILVIYDDLIERNNMDYVSFLNMSVECLSECPFAKLEATTPDKFNTKLIFSELFLETNNTAAAQKAICERFETDSPDAPIAFVISIARNTDLRRVIKQVTTTSNIPTFQMQHAPWSFQRVTAVNNTVDSEIAVNTTEIAPTAVSPNYATMIPPATVYLNLIYDMVMEINISREVTVLYDDLLRECPIQTSLLCTAMNDPTWKAMLKRVPLTFTYIAMDTNATLIDKQLIELKNTVPKITTLLLIAKAANVESYVMQAKEMIDDNIFEWFVYTTDVSSLMCHECTSVKLFWARPNNDLGDFTRVETLKYRQQTQKTEEGIDPLVEVTDQNIIYASYFLDLASLAWEFIRETQEKADIYPIYGCFNNSLGTDENRTITLQELMEADGSRKATFGPWVADETKQNWYFVNTLGKFFQIAFEMDQKQTKQTGNWTIEQGVMAAYSQGLLVDVRDIHVYRIVTVEQPPFVERVLDPETGEYKFEGYCIDLMMDIQKKLMEQDKPFNYTIYLATDGMYGTINDKEEWNGMIGDLVAGEAEIALGALSVMAERENYVDFTVPYYDLVGTTILMRRPDQSTSLFEFMRVLEWPVWLCIVAAYFFTSLLLWLFDKFSPYSYTNNKDKYKDDPEKREFTFKECLWFCMTSLTPQGGGEAPKNISGRLVAATWWLFGFIIIASYTANLAAFLTVSRLETNIKSLDDLYKQYKIRYAPVKGSASETYFRRMSEIEAKFYDLWKEMSLNDSMDAKERAKLAVWDYPVSDKFTNMWRFMEDSKLPETTDEGIDRVLKSSGEENGDGFAFIGDATVIKYAELTNCQLYKVGNEFSRKPYAIAVQQNSPLKDIISKAILQLLNERQLEKLREKWWTDNKNKQPCEKTDNESEGISIKNIGGVFIVILAGIVLSIVTLVFEYYYYKHKPMKKAKQLQAQQARNGGNHTMTAMVIGDNKANGITENGNGVHSRRGSVTNRNGNPPNYPGMANGNGAAGNGGIRDQYSMEYNNTAFDTKEN